MVTLFCDLLIVGVISFCRTFLSSLSGNQSTIETERCKEGQTTHQHTVHSFF